MMVKFPKAKTAHKRTVHYAEPVFIICGQVVRWTQACLIYRQLQQAMDMLDVQQEIDFREEEGDYTKTEVHNLRLHAQEVANDYRAVLDEDGHWNTVLVGVMDMRR